MTKDEQEVLEKEAKEYLAEQFVRVMEVDHVDADSTEGGGTYLHFHFDTIRNPVGEGDFRISLVKTNDGDWLVADYEALPIGGHRA